MNWGLVRTIIVLPGNVLVFIPAAILWISGRLGYFPKFAAADQFFFWVALLAASIGLCLSIWTVTLFMKFSKGTPAPWDPPKKLVIRGPYCYVRNPMIIGVLLILLAEALLFQSWPIAAWMAVFFIGNSIYFPLVEEKSLEKRFGEDYTEYKAYVRRWVPRLRAWTGP
jgi:protein-S-isoprenylcysteine O-methyltransferase Ste14